MQLSCVNKIYRFAGERRKFDLQNQEFSYNSLAFVFIERQREVRLYVVVNDFISSKQ